MTLGLLLLIVFLALAASIVGGFRRPRIWLALTVTGAVVGMGAALQVRLGLVALGVLVIFGGAQ